MLHLHPNWRSQFGIEATNRAQGPEATLTQEVRLLRIRSRVLRLEEDRFTLIIRLGIKQYFRTSTPFAKDYKSRVDRYQAQSGIDAGSALECMNPQMGSQKCLL